MTTYNLHDAKTHLSSLVEQAQKGEEVVIARYGVPVAKLIPLENRRKLGTYPITFSSDLLEATDPELVASFYEGA